MLVAFVLVACTAILIWRDPIARRLGIAEICLSLSHSDHYAVAHALALGDGV